MLEYNQERICTLCESPFKITVQNNLEKRCHACRHMKLNSSLVRTYEQDPVIKNVYIEVGKHSDYLLSDYNELHEHSNDVYHSVNNDTIEEDTVRNELLYLFMTTINSMLTKDEILVISMSYGVYGSDLYYLNEISKLLNISKKQIRILKDRAFNKIKRHLTIDRFKKMTDCDITLSDLLSELRI